MISSFLSQQQKNSNTPTKSKQGTSCSDDASPRSKAVAINNLEKNLYIELASFEQEKLNVLFELEKLPPKGQEDEG
jgi:hypothetical protein